MVTFRAVTFRSALRRAAPLALFALAAAAPAPQLVPRPVPQLRPRLPIGPVPATEPAPAIHAAGDPVGPPTVTREQILRNVNDLNDLSSDRREAAYQSLLNLGPGDLANLTSIASELSPLTIEQSDVVRDVAIHLYLSTVGYDAEPPTSVDKQSCMGITLGQENETTPLEDGKAVPAIAVIGRVPGFPAYAALHDGDQIIAVRTPSGAAGVADFRDFISSSVPGTVVTVIVMREGKLTPVQVRLRPRPFGYSGPVQGPGSWMTTWKQLGQDWWDRDVVPKLTHPVGIHAPATQP